MPLLEIAKLINISYEDLVEILYVGSKNYKDQYLIHTIADKLSIPYKHLILPVSNIETRRYIIGEFADIKTRIRTSKK